MFKIYCRAWPAASLALVGITKAGSARTQTDKYLVKHGLDATQWTQLWHWNLHTDDHRFAQKMVTDLKVELRSRYWRPATRLMMPGRGRADEILQLDTNGLRQNVYRVLTELGFHEREPALEGGRSYGGYYGSYY